MIALREKPHFLPSTPTKTRKITPNPTIIRPSPAVPRICSGPRSRNFTAPPILLCTRSPAPLPRAKNVGPGHTRMYIPYNVRQE